MQPASELFSRYKSSPNSRLLADALRVPVEQAVSAYLGKPWRVETFDDMNDFASHPSAVLTGGGLPVFVKLSEAAHGARQLEVELEGLRLLNRLAGVRIPTPIGLVPVEGGVILVLEGVQAVTRSPEHWREIGRTLARIHQVKGAFCGLETQGYFGPLYQDNRPAPDWLTFYIERRLWPRLIGAIDAGHLPSGLINQLEKFIDHLPGRRLPEQPICLLHGDAQQNNFISTDQGAFVIDPAVHYGSPEMDLAYVDYFQPVPADVFDGYQEIRPIDPGFGERRDLWRIAAYLAAVQVMGPAEIFRLERALKAYE